MKGLLVVIEPKRQLGHLEDVGRRGGGLWRSALSPGPYRWLWLIGPHSSPIKSSWPTAHVKLVCSASPSSLFKKKKINCTYHRFAAFNGPSDLEEGGSQMQSAPFIAVLRQRALFKSPCPDLGSCVAHTVFPPVWRWMEMGQFLWSSRLPTQLPAFCVCFADSESHLDGLHASTF